MGHHCSIIIGLYSGIGAIRFEGCCDDELLFLYIWDIQPLLHGRSNGTRRLLALSHHLPFGHGIHNRGRHGGLGRLPGANQATHDNKI